MPYHVVNLHAKFLPIEDLALVSTIQTNHLLYLAGIWTQDLSVWKQVLSRLS